MRATILLLLSSALPALAQQPECHEGPGAAFGVTAYNCSNCGIVNRADGKIGFVFNTEPVVLGTRGPTGLKPGDRIEAINGYSIRTADGANQFTYPIRDVPSVITLIRDGKRMSVEAQRVPLCGSFDRADYSAAVQMSQSRNQSKSGKDEAGRFGFALACRPSCTFARASDGGTYYKFDGYPPIVALRPRGPAELAGLKVGDIVTQIDGKSILEEAGALPYLRSARVRTLAVTVLREGHERTYIIQMN